MLLVYGVNVDSEDWNPITHVLVLTPEEAGQVEDLEDLMRRFGHRLLAAEALVFRSLKGISEGA